MQAAASPQRSGATRRSRLAVEAGNDMLLFANQQIYDPELPTKVIDTVESLVRSGRVTEAAIERSVDRASTACSMRRVDTHGGGLLVWLALSHREC